MPGDQFNIKFRQLQQEKTDPDKMCILNWGRFHQQYRCEDTAKFQVRMFRNQTQTSDVNLGMTN